MGRHYLNEAEAASKWSLPSIVVEYREGDEVERDDDGEPLGDGYYACFGLPGCLPDSTYYGPYKSEAEAVAWMREVFGDE